MGERDNTGDVDISLDQLKEIMNPQKRSFGWVLPLIFFFIITVLSVGAFCAGGLLLSVRDAVHDNAIQVSKMNSQLTELAKKIDALCGASMHLGVCEK